MRHCKGSQRMREEKGGGRGCGKTILRVKRRKKLN